ncbi:hypothetical protein [Micromonospora sp. CPCC 205558]|uniref:hypothetical protein n=1 Tax=Micromonospora sp. CPCC 205558 TaxID=3122403 RepID=UPI002FF24816
MHETRPEQVRDDVGVVRLFEPIIREVGSPLTEEMLRPLDPRCEVVQFGHPLSDADFQTLADWLRDYPAVTLRAFADGTGADLDFLRFFPTLRAFHADFSYRTLVSLDGLNHLPADLTYLGLGQTKKRLSLAPLARFTELQRLYLEGQSKDIEVIGHLRTITSLTLRSITLPNLSLLVPLTRLRALDLKLGGTRDLALLPEVGALQYLELWMVRGLHDLTPIADIPTLEYLFLQALKQVAALPSFGNCTHLTRVHLETMNGLSDLTPLLTAPALTQLTIADMPQLQPADVAVLAAHPTLQQLSAGLGSRRKNDEVARLLPLPPVHGIERHPALAARTQLP